MTALLGSRRATIMEGLLLTALLTSSVDIEALLAIILTIVVSRACDGWPVGDAAATSYSLSTGTFLGAIGGLHVAAAASTAGIGSSPGVLNHDVGLVAEIFSALQSCTLLGSMLLHEIHVALLSLRCQLLLLFIEFLELLGLRPLVIEEGENLLYLHHVTLELAIFDDQLQIFVIQLLVELLNLVLE